MQKISILITEDHILLGETWSYILNSDERFNVVALCNNAEDSIKVIKELKPDVVLMDINLPGLNGLDATEIIKEVSPATKVLGVSLHTQPNYARKMIKNGAMGYLTKNSPKDEMVFAIMEVYEGRKYICREIKEILSEQILNGEEDANGIQTLSDREMQIVEYIRKGLSSKEIAEALQISIKTVEVHRYNILKKLKLKNAAALVNYINKQKSV